MPSRSRRLARIYIGMTDPRPLRDTPNRFALQLIGCDCCTGPARPSGAQRSVTSRRRRRRAGTRGGAQRTRDVARLLGVYARRHPTLCGREWVETLSAVVALLDRLSAR
jgi:hypothetical protein